MPVVIQAGALPAPAEARSGEARHRKHGKPLYAPGEREGAYAAALLSFSGPSRFGQLISSTVPFSPRK